MRYDDPPVRFHGLRDLSLNHAFPEGYYILILEDCSLPPTGLSNAIGGRLLTFHERFQSSIMRL